MKSQSFSTAAVLSLVNGTLYDNGSDHPFHEVKCVASFLVGRSLYTHEMVGISDQLRPFLPEFPKYLPGENWREYQTRMEAQFGKTITLQKGDVQ